MNKENLTQIYTINLKARNCKREIAKDYYFDKDLNIYSAKHAYTNEDIKQMKIDMHENNRGAKPTIILGGRFNNTIESMVIATFFSSDNDNRRVSLTYRIGDDQIIPKQRKLAIPDTVKVNSGFMPIYLDGNLKNFSPSNIKLVPLIEYYRWCSDNHYKPTILDKHKYDILNYSKIRGYTGWGNDAIILSETFHLTYKTIRAICSDNISPRPLL